MSLILDSSAWVQTVTSQRRMSVRTFMGMIGVIPGNTCTLLQKPCLANLCTKQTSDFSLWRGGSLFFLKTSCFLWTSIVSALNNWAARSVGGIWCLILRRKAKSGFFTCVSVCWAHVKVHSFKAEEASHNDSNHSTTAVPHLHTKVVWTQGPAWRTKTGFEKQTSIHARASLHSYHA